MLRARSQASVADKGRALHVAVRQDRHVLSNPDWPLFSVDDDARLDPGSRPTWIASGRSKCAPAAI